MGLLKKEKVLHGVGCSNIVGSKKMMWFYFLSSFNSDNSFFPIIPIK